jgi:hypothetical protein
MSEVVEEIGTGYRGRCPACKKIVTGRKGVLRKVWARQMVQDHLRDECGVEAR